MSIADGESRRMAYPRGVFSHQSCSTFTLMTSQSTMERVTSYTQMIYVSQPSTLHSQKLPLGMHWTNSYGITDPTVCVQTQFTAFHLRYKEANRSLKVEWNRTELENTPDPKYLGVTLDRMLSYKEHIHNTKKKVATRKKVVPFEMGSKHKYHKNNSISIMLFCS